MYWNYFYYSLDYFVFWLIFDYKMKRVYNPKFKVSLKNGIISRWTISGDFPFDDIMNYAFRIIEKGFNANGGFVNAIEIEHVEFYE